MDWLRAPVRDVIKPFRDSNIEVTREWYPVPRGTPSLGFPHAFGSAHWEPFPYLPRNVGEVFPSQYEFIRKATPNGLNFEHFCGTEEEFQKGAVFNPDLPPRVYNADGIPECCMPSTCNCEEQRLELPAAPTTVITPITGSTVMWSGGGAHLPAMRLPAREAAVIYLLPITLAAGSARILPPLGERINGASINSSITVGPGTTLPGMLRAVRYAAASPFFPGRWWEIKPVDLPAPQLLAYRSALAASFTITAAAGTYQNTGLQIQLPFQGQWRISGQIQATVNPNAAGAHTIDVRLYDQTAAAVVPDSESRICRSDQIGIPSNLTGAVEALYVVNQPTTIELQAARTGTAWNNSQIVSAATGRSALVATGA